MECAREALEHVGRSGDGAVDGAAVRHPVTGVRLLAPLPRPNSLRDFLVFEAHLRNVSRVLGPSRAAACGVVSATGSLQGQP